MGHRSLWWRGREKKRPDTGFSLTQPTPVNSNAVHLNATIDNKCESCVYCNNECDDKDALQCRCCLHYHHLICCGLKLVDFPMALEIGHLLGWMCEACRIESTESIRLLRCELNELRNTLESINIKTNNSSTLVAANEASYSGVVLGTASNQATATTTAERTVRYSEVVKVVSKTITDASRRKRNVIFSGIPEPMTSQYDHQQTDKQSVSDLCDTINCLNICDKIRSVKRIGKAFGSKPRRLLIVLISESVAEDLIIRARLFRNSADSYVRSNIFINRDLTPEEAREAYERRQARRSGVVGSTRGQHDNMAGHMGGNQGIRSDRVVGALEQSAPVHMEDRTFWRSSVSSSTRGNRNFANNPNLILCTNSVPTTDRGCSGDSLTSAVTINTSADVHVQSSFIPSIDPNLTSFNNESLDPNASIFLPAAQASVVMIPAALDTGNVQHNP